MPTRRRTHPATASDTAAARPTIKPIKAAKAARAPARHATKPSTTPPTTRLTGQLDVRTALGAFLSHTRVRLLEAIDQHGSISQAAPQVPLSYKAAWDAVDAMTRLADQPLVQRSAGGRAGGGTVLTEHGRRLVALYRAMQAEYQTTLDQLAGQFASTPVGDMPAYQHLLRRLALRTSARNQFIGTVCGLVVGKVDVTVQVRLLAPPPGSTAPAPPQAPLQVVVTRGSADTLALALGSAVIVLVKSPALQLLAADAAARPGANRLHGTVQHIVRSAGRAEVTLGLDSSPGTSATAVLPSTALATLGLAVGMAACATFDPASAILVMID